MWEENERMRTACEDAWEGTDETALAEGGAAKRQ